MIRLKELRKKHNLSQEELGKMLFTSNQTISNWEFVSFQY